jgi:hypothetical protein
MISDVHNALHVEVLPFDPMISDVHNALHVEILCKSTCIVQNDGIYLDEPSIHVKAVWDNNNCQSFNNFQYKNQRQLYFYMLKHQHLGLFLIYH